MNPEDQAEGRPLTNRQLLIWTEQTLAPDIPANNMLMCFTIEGDVDPNRFARAFEAVVSEADALRTVIQQRDGAPLQFVRPNAARLVEFVDLSDDPDHEGFFAWRDTRCLKRFALDEQLFDCALIRLGKRRSIWYLCQHHIICDAWSFSLIFKRVADLYSEAETIPGLDGKRTFRKYLDLERNNRDSNRYAASAAFWKERFSIPIEPLRPYGVDPAGKRSTTQRLSVEIGDLRAHKIRDLALRETMRATTPTLSLSLLFTTVFYAYLHRISGNERIGLGCPVLNRPSRWSKQTIGLFMEVCPFGVQIAEEDSFVSLHQKTLEENFTVLPHSSFSVSNPTRNKRYDAMLNFHNAVIPEFAGMPVHSDLRSGSVAMASQQKLDDIDAMAGWDPGDCLTLQILDFADTGSFRLHFEFNTDVFDGAARKRAVEHFMNLLDAMLADPECLVCAAPMLTVGELKEVLSDAGDARELEKPVDESIDGQTVLDRFRSWVVRDRERVALIHGNAAQHADLRYGELDDRVRILASAMREAGVVHEDRVAVCLTRSSDLVVALLAAHDASAAYVPIDPDQPTPRIALILEEARPALLITEASLAERLQACPAPRILLGGDFWDGSPIPPVEASPRPAAATARSLAYVIFTSGSTGRPKGVEIEHRALSNLIASMAHTPGLSKSDRLLAITTISFDISALEVFLPLTVGACLEIADEETCQDPERLARRLESSAITVMQATPATWQMLVDSGWTGRSELRALCGGDALSRELADALLERTGEVWNLYGPTETTIWSSVARVEPGSENICIGQPIDRTLLRVLTAGFAPVPDGVPGELFIAGDGLARGYCRQPGLTAERFLLTPESADRLFYRTGDRVRRWPDGRLECLGRVDFQVKIRGFRIELGEIEAALRRFEELAEAVVIARGENSRDRHLVAYLVPQKVQQQPSIESISASLKSDLPSYMIPMRWIVVDRLPLTANGKVDRKRVAALLGRETHVTAQWEALRNDTEVQIAEIWRHVLVVPDVGRDDDFFDLGGNSLLALDTLRMIEKRVDQRIPLATFFDQPTIAGLSNALSRETVLPDSDAAVELRGGTGEIPIFCIGGIQLYQALARELGPMHRVFGVFLAREADWIAALEQGDHPQLASTEQTAADYIEAIKVQQPEGPYRLAGLSYGGVLAYEMARQLRHRGERVDALILFDVRLQRALARAGGLLNRARHRFRKIRDGRAGRVALRQPHLDRAEIRDRLFVEAIRVYEQRIGPYDGSVLLCRARDHEPTYSDADPSFGWADLVRGELVIADCPGDHVGLIAGDNAASTAEKIEAFLDSRAGD